MSTQSKPVTLGDVGRGAVSLLKRATSTVKEGAAELQKADLSPAKIKDRVENATVSATATLLVKAGIVIFVIYAAWKLFGRKFR